MNLSSQRKLFENLKKFLAFFQLNNCSSSGQMTCGQFLQKLQKKKTRRRHLNFPAKVTSDAAANYDQSHKLFCSCKSEHRGKIS